ncbi:hypothetical protein KPA97_67795, partial [Burkholderia cenocepacia]|nr:hypothetical protein [Burkholderia cenocepacia]
QWMALVAIVGSCFWAARYVEKCPGGNAIAEVPPPYFGQHAHRNHSGSPAWRPKQAFEHVGQFSMKKLAANGSVLFGYQ